MPRYILMNEETEHFLEVILDSKQLLQNTKCFVQPRSSKWGLRGRDFMRILTYALQTIQRKHLQIAIVLCQNFRNIAFILHRCNGNAAIESILFVLAFLVDTKTRFLWMCVPIFVAGLFPPRHDNSSIQTSSSIKLTKHSLANWC